MSQALVPIASSSDCKQSGSIMSLLTNGDKRKCRLIVWSSPSFISSRNRTELQAHINELDYSQKNPESSYTMTIAVDDVDVLVTIGPVENVVPMQDTLNVTATVGQYHLREPLPPFIAKKYHLSPHNLLAGVLLDWTEIRYRFASGLCPPSDSKKDIYTVSTTQSGARRLE